MEKDLFYCRVEVYNLSLHHMSFPEKIAWDDIFTSCLIYYYENAFNSFFVVFFLHCVSGKVSQLKSNISKPLFFFKHTKVIVIIIGERKGHWHKTKSFKFLFLVFSKLLLAEIQFFLFFSFILYFEVFFSRITFNKSFITFFSF